MPVSIDERVKKAKTKPQEAIRFLDDLMGGGDIVTTTHSARACCMAALRFIGPMEKTNEKQ